MNYDGDDFPGEITCCDGNDQFEVSVMHKSGNHCKWPKTIDKIIYARDDIVRTINLPRATVHCGQLFDNCSTIVQMLQCNYKRWTCLKI